MSRTARNKPLREALQHHYRTIIWDWNGTLLDDVDISIAATNMLLEERGLPLLDKKRYQEVFDFPVKDYYARIGFGLKRKLLLVAGLSRSSRQRQNRHAEHKEATQVPHRTAPHLRMGRSALKCGVPASPIIW